MSNKAFYNSKAWKDKRAYILKRDGYLCQECKKYGKNIEAKLVHHIIEIDEEYSLRLKNSNLVSVCHSCHNKEHPEKGGHHINR
jgi:5-methylcytosine-specific restriction enzyme A